MKQSKMLNKKVTIDNIVFSSGKEGRRYEELKLMLGQGLIENLRLQVKFELLPSCIIDGRKRPATKYIADFVYIENGQDIIEDSKGRMPKINKRTGKRDNGGAAWQLFSLKRHIMKVNLGLDIKIT
jgi:hypothetical protein